VTAGMQSCLYLFQEFQTFGRGFHLFVFLFQFWYSYKITPYIVFLSGLYIEVVAPGMPGATTTMVFFYVYVLESLKDKKRYIGFTTNIRKRLEEHQKGKSFATKSRLPMKCIYIEACTNRNDAERREKYLKTTRGRRFLVKRLKSYYSQSLL
jgi:putative endonuclease